jgi:adenylosuccinate lyase
MSTKGQAMAESVMIALVAKGLGRQEAQGIVQQTAMRAREKALHLKETLARTRR